jgi:hypothetical protein
MAFDPYTNRVPFGLLTDDEKAALKAHPGPWVYMDPSDLRDGLAPDWTEIDSADWWPEFVYCAARPAPEPLWIAPEVWRVLDPKWQWAAADNPDGKIYLYTGAPSCGFSTWQCGDDGDYLFIFNVIAPHLIRRGTVPWDQSLIQRPEDL